MATTAGVPDPAAASSQRWRRGLLTLLTVALVALAGYGVQARASGPGAAANPAAAPGTPLTWLRAQGTSLPAVGRVDGLALPCTAWLLDVGAAPESSAYAVTAGRCTGVDDSATVLADQDVTGAEIVFRLFSDGRASGVDPVVEPVARVRWASGRGTDLAVLQLGTSYGELAASGVTPIAVAAPLDPGGELLVAGVPVAGGGADGTILRGDRCQAGARTGVAEGPWVFRDLQASDCVGTLTGSAGTPAFDADGAAVGMVVTTTIASGNGPACELRRPCELAEGVVSVRPDTSYLAAVAGLTGCFAEGAFTLGSGCPLEQPASVVPAQVVGGDQVPAGGQIVVATADGSAGSVLTTKAGMLAEADCWDVAGWSATAVGAGDTLVVTAPATQGLGLVCVGSAAQPTPLRVTVTTAGPDPAQIRVEQAEVAGGLRIQPVADPPELASFDWVLVPGRGVDCSVVEGYAQAPTEPTFVPAADLPATVCVVARDQAGNPSPPVAVALG